MKFEMSFGLKIGCFCFVLSFIIQNSTAQNVYGIYIKNKPRVAKLHKISNNVYWDNLAKAFRQNPAAIMSGIEDSRARRLYKKRIFRDQYGRRFIWDPVHGLLPVVKYSRTTKAVDTLTVLYMQSVTGYVTGQLNKKLKLLIPMDWLSIPQNQTPNNVNCDPQTIPFLSFNDGELQGPCTGSGRTGNKAEFGLTATSGMSDILCTFCHHIKNLQCIWRFCSHPDGVYKIKVSDHKG